MPRPAPATGQASTTSKPQAERIAREVITGDRQEISCRSLASARSAIDDAIVGSSSRMVTIGLLQAPPSPCRAMSWCARSSAQGTGGWPAGVSRGPTPARLRVCATEAAQ